MKDIKFDLDDIVLIPSECSVINSRKECNIDILFNNKVKLPLIAAPMDTVVSKENYIKFIENGIIPCIPRGVENCEKDNEHIFKSYSLNEIEEQLLTSIQNKNHFSNYPNILIDIANGHMQRLLDVVINIKKTYPNITLMVGNIANPETFVNLGLAGADFIRCSIGTGCFIPGQVIKTDNKEKNIEKVEIGDKVLTHTGEYKNIKNKFEYAINDEIYEINDIKCTQNHEFYILEKQYENIVNDENLSQYAKWISAKDLDVNKHFLIQY